PPMCSADQSPLSLSASTRGCAAPRSGGRLRKLWLRWSRWSSTSSRSNAGLWLSCERLWRQRLWLGRSRCMLARHGYVDLPPPTGDGTSEFDHGDVHRATGRVFVAHTAANTVEVLDGASGEHSMTLAGCPEGSGVLCAQDEGIVFAAARGAGKVLVIEARSGRTLSEIAVGPRPSGVAWDMVHQRLLVADVQENQARLLAPLDFSGNMSQTPAQVISLPGRPRWCVYDHARSRFLINIRKPAGVAILSADTGE